MTTKHTHEKGKWTDRDSGIRNHIESVLLSMGVWWEPSDAFKMVLDAEGAV